MHLDTVSKAVIDVILGCDLNNHLEGVYHAEDPDQLPTSVPTCSFVFNPGPFQKVFDEFLMEWTFWYKNPDLRKISVVIDQLEIHSNEWISIRKEGAVIGQVWYIPLKSPLTGGRSNLRYITLFIKFRASINEDVCQEP